jgi:hypothetical protein
MEQDRIGEMAEEILRYLQAHPHASDTAEGICRWWLPEGLECSTSKVTTVLEGLVAQGSLSNGTLLYQRPSAV